MANKEKARLVLDLGDKHNLILRNHGLLACAETVADAFLYMYILQKACEVQVRAQAGGMIAWPGILRKLDRIDPSWRE